VIQEAQRVAVIDQKNLAVRIAAAMNGQEV